MEAQKLYPAPYHYEPTVVAVAAPYPSSTAAGYGAVPLQPHQLGDHPHPYGQQQQHVVVVPPSGPAAVYAPIASHVNVCFAPFYFRTYALILYFVLVSFAWGLFAACWTISTVSSALGAVAACGVGLVLLPAFAYTWRALAHADVALTKVFCPPADLTATVVMRPICPTYAGLGSWIKVNLLNTFTWRCVAYFVFWRLIWTTITFSVVTGTLSLALALLTKPFMGMSGVDPFEHCAECGWFLGSHGVYAIDLALGVVVFYLLCVKVHFLAMVERRVCWAVLGERTVNALDYGSYTVVPSPASKLQDTQMTVNMLIDPADAKQRATFLPYAVPAAPIVPYARRGRSHFLRTCAFCACCCVCGLLVLAGVVAGLLAARCASATKQTSPLDFRWSAADATAVGIDLSGAGFGGSVTLRESANSTTDVAAHGTISYIKAGDRDWAAYFDGAVSDGVLRIASSRLRWWDAIRTCATVDFTLEVPQQPEYSRRPSLRINTANAHVAVGPIGPAALNAYSDVSIQTSNAKVELGEYGPTTTDLTVVTSNARITAGRLNVSGEAILRTSNADITVGELEAVTLSLETSNADIDVQRLRFPAVTSVATFFTSNADIELGSVAFRADARASLQARTSNGDAEVTATHLEGSLSLTTSSGSADVDNRSGRQLRLVEDAKDRKRGTVGSAGLHDVALSTSNADAALVLLP